MTWILIFWVNTTPIFSGEYATKASCEEEASAIVVGMEGKLDFSCAQSVIQAQKERASRYENPREKHEPR